MSHPYQNSDPANWRQYHPVLQQMWHIQLTAYKPKHLKNAKQPQQPHPKDYSQRKEVQEGFSEWFQHSHQPPFMRSQQN